MDSSAIGDQIELILRSQTFASKGQLRKLLGVLLKNIDSQAALSPELVIRELWPGLSSTSCPNGEPYYQGTCEIATLALP